MNLTLAVTKTDFAQAASGSGTTSGAGAANGGEGGRKESTASLQISGQVVNENEFVRLGAYHTLDLEGELPWMLVEHTVGVRVVCCLS